MGWGLLLRGQCRSRRQPSDSSLRRSCNAAPTPPQSFRGATLRPRNRHSPLEQSEEEYGALNPPPLEEKYRPAQREETDVPSEWATTHIRRKPEENSLPRVSLPIELPIKKCGPHTAPGGNDERILRLYSRKWPTNYLHRIYLGPRPQGR